MTANQKGQFIYSRSESELCGFCGYPECDCQPVEGEAVVEVNKEIRE